MESDSEPIEECWIVYILRCSDDTFYTGITNDLDRRFGQHNSGKASRYTRSRLPVEVVHQEDQPTKSAALKRELAIKALSRTAKQSLICPKNNAACKDDAKTACDP